MWLSLTLRVSNHASFWSNDAAFDGGDSVWPRNASTGLPNTMSTGSWSIAPAKSPKMALTSHWLTSGIDRYSTLL